MPTKRYLIPGYVLYFKCAMCTECCKRWRITFDRQTVEHYEKLAAEDPELAAMLSDGLKKSKNGDANVRLKNRIKTETTGIGEQGEALAAVDAAVCPFLTEDGFCAIQKKYGVEALSDTCKIFPRHIFHTERGWEMALTYACPTAADTLKEKKPVEFYQDPPGFDFPDLHGQYGRIGDFLERKKAGRTGYFEVEELLIDILQFREMDIDTRLILAGIMADKLKDGDVAGVRRYLRNLDDRLINQLETIPSQPAFMLKLVKEAVDKRLLSPVSESNMGKLLELAYNRLKLLDEAVISDEKVQRLLEGYDKYYRPHIVGASHVYENYFVNFVFSKKFYTHKYMDAYFLIVFFYTLIRFFALCACMADERGVNEDVLVGVIHAIERSIGHNQAYYEDVLRQIKQGDYHRLPYVVSLINL
ncbi:hypothetical protein Desca_1823 [Desulfotomaculum nigrificans CO-1-SRB]|uniref:FliB family protein n=1 Tax=Desulfotomaculum nigrificans (strain DSM 14880 / VKM B-2319 / CO-1-SRB) TaxID=868595 RepID=F6B8A5_DESCC|nr:flagellin lysine-N-methylase [Desulfotomaculum nigrificans]AEF94669.1 hypothetical protein Desca_1823 [Desulfotomaculum nigrificans CO-1-SRB]